MDENKLMFTMHDILDAQHMYEANKDESYLRKVVMPLEIILVKHKRIIMKVSSNLSASDKNFSKPFLRNELLKIFEGLFS